jgi:hypothetical protein
LSELIYGYLKSHLSLALPLTDKSRVCPSLSLSLYDI